MTLPLVEERAIIPSTAVTSVIFHFAKSGNPRTFSSQIHRESLRSFFVNICVVFGERSKVGTVIFITHTVPSRLVIYFVGNIDVPPSAVSLEARAGGAVTSVTRDETVW